MAFIWLEKQTVKEFSTEPPRLIFAQRWRCSSSSFPPTPDGPHGYLIQSSGNLSPPQAQGSCKISSIAQLNIFYLLRIWNTPVAPKPLSHVLSFAFRGTKTLPSHPLEPLVPKQKHSAENTHFPLPPQGEGACEAFEEFCKYKTKM